MTAAGRCDYSWTAPWSLGTGRLMLHECAEWEGHGDLHICPCGDGCDNAEDGA